MKYASNHIKLLELLCVNTHKQNIKFCPTNPSPCPFFPTEKWKNQTKKRAELHPPVLALPRERRSFQREERRKRARQAQVEVKSHRRRDMNLMILAKRLRCLSVAVFSRFPKNEHSKHLEMYRNSQTQRSKMYHTVSTLVK